MNYRELCQEFVAQFGLSGGTGPTTVANQTGELGNVVRWIRDADLYVNNLWEDWRFLWVAYAGTLSAGSFVPSVPNTPSGVRVRRWNTKSVKVRLATDTSWSRLTYMPHQHFLQTFDPDVEVSAAPTAFTVLPDNSLQFNCPADQAYLVKGEFWRSPRALAADTDVPLMPEEYHRLILVRALVFYADREDAPELVSGALSEYPDLLEKLEASQLDGQRLRRASTDVEQQRVPDDSGWL
jgi:hypothetical protein